MTPKEKITLIDGHIENLLTQPITDSSIIKYSIDGVSIEKKSIFEMIEALQNLKKSIIAENKKLPDYIQVLL